MIGTPWPDLAGLVEKRFDRRISNAMCYHLYNQFTESLSEYRAADQREEILAVENDRLDRLQKAFWASAMLGDDKAAQVILKVMAHRSKINGLDQIDLSKAANVANVLVVGQNQKEWLEMLDQHYQVTSGISHDGEGQEDGDE